MPAIPAGPPTVSLSRSLFFSHSVSLTLSASKLVRAHLGNCYQRALFGALLMCALSAARLSYSPSLLLVPCKFRELPARVCCSNLLVFKRFVHATNKLVQSEGEDE